MTFLVFSDSHGSLHNLRAMMRAMEKEGLLDGILYAGDGIRDLGRLQAACPIYAVRGNCDALSPAPTELLVPLDTGNLYLCHGHLHGVKRGLTDLRDAARLRGAGVAVYGHTHRQGFDYVEGIFCLNPGALDLGQYAILSFRADGRPVPKFFTL